MINTIKNIYVKYKAIINYIFFGGLTAIVNIGIKYILLFTCLNPEHGIELQIAIVISWIAAVIFAYFTNRKFVFQSTNKNQLKEFTHFVIGRLTTLLLEMFIMWFFITFLALNSDLYVIIFTLISQALVIIGNYFFSKLLVFKK